MPRLIIISNRLPVTVNRKQGELIFYPSAGGLATGLNSLDESIDKTWIGWPGEALDDEWERESVKRDLARDHMVPVFLSEEDIELYYEGFSNKVIWPHFHYFTQFTSYEDKYWDAYQRVNQQFAQVVVESIKPDDMIWVHDYQLLLLPALIRRSFPDISIGFFLHIPFLLCYFYSIILRTSFTEIVEQSLPIPLTAFDQFPVLHHMNFVRKIKRRVNLMGNEKITALFFLLNSF